MREKLMKDEMRVQLLDAFDRVVHKKTIHIKKGASLSAANVIRETGRAPDQVKIARYPSIQSKILEEKARIKEQKAISEQRTSKSRRNLKAQFEDAKKQRDKLASIVSAQNEYILDLLNELERNKDNVVSFKSKQ
jgi:hypothetical protein